MRVCLCLFEGDLNVYLCVSWQHGEQWQKNACTTCVCDRGQSKCHTNTCRPIVCDKVGNLTHRRAHWHPVLYRIHLTLITLHWNLWMQRHGTWKIFCSLFISFPSPCRTLHWLIIISWNLTRRLNRTAAWFDPVLTSTRSSHWHRAFELKFNYLQYRGWLFLPKRKTSPHRETT